MVRFIHCSDLHLDSPFKSKSHISPKIFEDVQKVLMKVLKYCRYCITTRC